MVYNDQNIIGKAVKYKVMTHDKIKCHNIAAIATFTHSRSQPLIVAQLKSDSLNLSSVYKSIIFFELYI
jgi:hypothetical protein